MLFADDVRVEFMPEEWDVLARPVNGEGGAQGLLRELLATEVRPCELCASYVLLDKAYAYAYDYGNGGFQDRFRVVVKAALRTGDWTPQGIVEGTRRQRGGAFGRADRKGR